MTNFAAVLKAEIIRLARKTVKADLAALKSANALQRKQIAGLKAQVLNLERGLARLQKELSSRSPPVSDEPGTERSLRFSAKGLRSHRTKLGISAQDYAKLAGVSALSIYKWEAGKAHPRNAQVEALAGLRSLGKRAALAKLEETDGATN